MRQALSCSLVLLSVLALLPSAAAGDVRKGEGRFAFEETVLENGLRVISLEDHSTPIIAVQLWYHVGSKDEKPDRQGFAHMFEHMMFRGTDRLGPEDHFEHIRRTGGNCNAYTSFDSHALRPEFRSAPTRMPRSGPIGEAVRSTGFRGTLGFTSGFRVRAVNRWYAPPGAGAAEANPP